MVKIPTRFDDLLRREWFAVNHIGGYASSTLPSLNTRKYHGLLVAATRPPVGRMVLLSRVEEMVRQNGLEEALCTSEYPGVVHPRGYELLKEFTQEPCPTWIYKSEGWTIEKRLWMVAGKNAVGISYKVLEAKKTVELELRPLFALRSIHGLTYQWNADLSPRQERAGLWKIGATNHSPAVFFSHDGAYEDQACWYFNTIYRREQERGYGGLEDLWMAGLIKWRLAAGETARFVCSLEGLELGEIKNPHPVPLPGYQERGREMLARAAEQFIVDTGDFVGVIPTLPWDSPGTRAALAGLVGLFLIPRRFEAARRMLLSLARECRNGVIPSELAEDGSGWRYTAADVSLWFIAAVRDYLRFEPGDGEFAARMIPVAREIIEAYERGTELGIRTDDVGLLCIAAGGVPATWMDAKVGDWIITPRNGRPVEINALWYHALRAVAEMTADGEELLRKAQRVREAFNRRFWNMAAGCCFDVVEDRGNDASVRPNQILAASLEFAVLESSRATRMLEKVRSELLTPMGLRTLSPADPIYQGQYVGPELARGRAQHNGPAYPWLLGPYLRALNEKGARELLEPCLAWMEEAGMGQMRELFDGDGLQLAGNGPASALAVAKLLEALVEDSGG